MKQFLFLYSDFQCIDTIETLTSYQIVDIIEKGFYFHKINTDFLLIIEVYNE